MGHMTEQHKGRSVRVALLSVFLGACLSPLDAEEGPGAGADMDTVTAAVGETVVIDETFTSSAANFTVVSGGTWAVSNGQYVLTNPGSSTVNGNISVHNTAVSGDFILSADGKVTGTTTSAWNDFSIIFNYRDASNYYYVSLNESNDSGTNGVFKVVAGAKTELADITSVITAETLYSVKVERTGSGIKAFRNGVLVASVSDATFTGGKIGLGSMNDGATFDNVKVLKPATSAPLSWRPPALTSPTTVTVSNTNRSLNLDPTRDYIIKFGEVISAGNLSITGGRNVVLIGGHITVPWRGAWPVDGNARRGLYLKHWTGTMHVEGLLIDGEDLAEGIDVDTRTVGATLQVQNVRVGFVHGRPEESACYTCSGVHHPDIIQNWGGPTYYRIDRLTGSTDYQGFMIQPIQFGNPTTLADFRNMNLVGEGGYLFFRAPGTNDFVFQNVYLHKASGSRYAYPESDPEWNGFTRGVAPGGDFVPAGVAGMNYVSPGYAN